MTLPPPAELPACAARQPTLAALLAARPLLVVDLECTCMLFRPDEDQVQELIEFGHTVLALPSAEVELPPGQSMYVRPTATPVTRGCTKLTGITPQMVAKAPHFTERMAELGAWVHAAGLAGWASWGDFDPRMLARQCAREGVANPLEALPHFNAKQLLSHWLATLQGTTVRERQGGYGLRTALVALGLNFEGREHSGAADAYNTARVIQAARQRGAVEPPRPPKLLPPPRPAEAGNADRQATPAPPEDAPPGTVTKP
jgi:inhibitor of KinA sporulation pathway (predicted exonuclease)